MTDLAYGPIAAWITFSKHPKDSIPSGNFFPLKMALRRPSMTLLRRFLVVLVGNPIKTSPIRRNP
jgi:hypothetical protein